MGYQPLSNHGAWTTDRVETATKMWDEGASASEIAKALRCGISRNAVIGKLHRLGLKRSDAAALQAQRLSSATKRDIRSRVAEERKRKGDERQAAKQPVRAPSRGVVSATSIRATAPDQPLPAPHADDVARIAEPLHHHCRWPVGDPKAPGFGFCGFHSGERTYCAEHTERAADRTQRPISASTVRWVASLDRAPAAKPTRDRGPWADAA